MKSGYDLKGHVHFIWEGLDDCLVSLRGIPIPGIPRMGCGTAGSAAAGLVGRRFPSGNTLGIRIQFKHRVSGNKVPSTIRIQGKAKGIDCRFQSFGSFLPKALAHPFPKGTPYPARHFRSKLPQSALPRTSLSIRINHQES